MAANGSPLRLDTLLSQVYPSTSRSFWKRQCDVHHRVVVDGAKAKAKTIVHEGSLVTILPPQRVPEYHKDIQVLYEDEKIVAANKPAGMLSVERRPGDHEASVQLLLSKTQKVKPCHRLDRDTSGVMLFAKSASALKDVQDQFRNRSVTKVYAAICTGNIPEGTFIIRRPIARHPNRSGEFIVHPHGKVAETTVTVIDWEGDTTHVRLSPKTGRTHQIRVHLQSLGHPIVGDSLYGHNDAKAERMYLHAHQISLLIPGDTSPTTITSPIPWF